MDTLKIYLLTPTDYAVGVSLFKQAASPVLKAKYLNYFTEIDTCDRNDPHFCMLLSKLSYIAENLQYVIHEPPIQHVEHTKRSQLKEDITPNTINRIDTSKLTEAQKQIYLRIKEITPLIGHLHSTLGEILNEDERKKTANELCDLDDERRKLWEELQNTVADREEEDNKKDVEKIVNAAEIARIKNNIRSLRLQSRRTTDPERQKAIQQRIDNYNAQLKELE